MLVFVVILTVVVVVGIDIDWVAVDDKNVDWLDVVVVGILCVAEIDVVVRLLGVDETGVGVDWNARVVAGVWLEMLTEILLLIVVNVKLFFVVSIGTADDVSVMIVLTIKAEEQLMIFFCSVVQHWWTLDGVKIFWLSIVKRNVLEMFIMLDKIIVFSKLNSKLLFNLLNHCIPSGWDLSSVLTTASQLIASKSILCTLTLFDA